MSALQVNTSLLPPALRALALGLLVETPVPLPNRPRGGGPMLLGQGEGGPGGKADWWRAVRRKCGELSALVLRADDPAEAAEYVLGYLPKHLEHVFERAAVPPWRIADWGLRAPGPQSIRKPQPPIRAAARSDGTR
jgi:hypothetical protein